MQTIIQITELSHDDLVFLFSTALYGSDTFTSFYLDKHYDSLPKKVRKDDECFEDKYATLLLNGKPIYITDECAEGEIYGKNKVYGRVNDDDENESVTYILFYDLMLKTINEQLSDDDRCFLIAFFDAPEEHDFFDAQKALQLIMWGEEIYG